MTRRTASDVVIWSADIDEERLLEAAYTGAAGLKKIKVSRYMLTVMGLGIISRLRALGFEVFADAKIVELPGNSEDLAGLHLAHKPWMLNCMADIVSNGDMRGEGRIDKKKRDGLKRFADACHAVRTRPCAVSVMTSKTPEVVAQQYNGRTPAEQVLVFAEWLVQAGFTNMVCSTEELLIIRSDPRFDFLDLDVPGIRLPGSDTRDQARIGTPRGAMEAGATDLVIGSNLTDGDLVENFARIALDLEPFLNAA